MKINYKVLTGISFALYGILNIINHRLIHLSSESIIGIPLIIFGISGSYISFNYKQRNLIVLSAAIFFTGIILLLDGIYKVYSYSTLILFIFFLTSAIFFLLFIEDTKQKTLLYSSLLLLIISYPSLRIFEYLKGSYFLYRYIKIENIILPLTLILAGIILFIRRND